MSPSTTVSWVLAAALLFWVVGAYNRLVRLRGELVRRFAPIEEQFRRRQALLLQQIDALEPVLSHAAPRLDALRAACRQADGAWAEARERPSRADAIASLRLAEAVLVEARARLPLPPPASSAQADVAVQLAAADSTLAFAQTQFNAAAAAYNEAVTEFPTRLLAGLFGFRAAAAL